MFGIGRGNRRMGSGTFGRNRLRNAAIAGIGMLALRWWRNRQAPGRNPAGAARRGGSPGTGSTRGWAP